MRAWGYIVLSYGYKFHLPSAFLLGLRFDEVLEMLEIALHFESTNINARPGFGLKMPFGVIRSALDYDRGPLREDYACSVRSGTVG